ncbi:MAG: hypothetical protein IKC26_10010 [Clostridia bacterium]|nr:hypothetical protein [Clostridia bacterium]MBR2908356.1 hypothetical protein [Clostridia bacterium]
MEKKGYTETLEWLQKLYPDRATISVKEAAKAMDASALDCKVDDLLN